MEESIRQAKEKAENYLFKELAKISTSLRRNDPTILNPLEWDGLPIRFEAHAYFCNKHQDLKPKYASELRDLWINWQKYRKDLEPKYLEYFWPIWAYRYPRNTGSLEFIGFTPWVNIAMLRAREVLGIPGFQDEFDKIIQVFKNHIIGGETDRDYWNIYRSRTIQDSLQKYIKGKSNDVLYSLERDNLHGDLKRFEKNREFKLEVLSRWIQRIIHLVMAKLGGDYISMARRSAESLIKYQDNNGSILTDIMTTSSFAISINLSGVDPSKIIQIKALEWLLNKQNEDGSWSHWADERDNIKSEWSILATVTVLETIDLITNDEPLPPWIPTERVMSTITEKQKSAITKFPLPKSIPWSELTVKFTSNRVVWFKHPEDSGAFSFYSVGLEHSKSKKPKVICLALVSLAKFKEISRSTRGLHPRIYKDPKSQIYRLKELFQEIFVKDDESPFQYNKKTRDWTPRFNLELVNDEIYYEIYDDFEVKFDLPSQKKFEE